MEKYWSDVFQLAQSTTQRIGSELIQHVGALKPEQKSDGSLVTQADQWADQVISEVIAITFPDHGIIAEETAHTLPHKDWCWAVDPIDGTTNFSRGVPIWAISLGLLYRGTPVFGYVYVPQLDQAFHGFWYGDSGLTGPTGAFLNGQPIHTSFDEPSPSHLFNLCARSTAVLKNPFPCKIRMIGVASYNLLLVAAGNAMGGVEATPKLWDIAAAWVIVQAAGGTFVSLEPDPMFPLQMGADYHQRSFPCLAVSRAELVPLFKPLVALIGQPLKRKSTSEQ